MLGRIRGYCGRFAGYLKMFRGVRDYRSYQRMKAQPSGGRPLPVRVRGVDHTLWCRPGTSDPVVLFDTFAGGYHLPTVALPDSPVILDLGANVGFTAVDFAVRYPTARVVAVEMDPTNCELARRNIGPLSSRITLVEAAVWEKEGQVVYGGEEAWGYRVVDGQAAGASGRVARAITLDTLLTECGITRADYVKMDIEGGEAAVVVPGAAWIERVRAIQVEWHHPATPDGITAALTAGGLRCTVGRRGILGARRSG